MKQYLNFNIFSLHSLFKDPYNNVHTQTLLINNGTDGNRSWFKIDPFIFVLYIVYLFCFQNITRRLSQNTKHFRSNLILWINNIMTERTQRTSSTLNVSYFFFGYSFFYTLHFISILLLYTHLISICRIYIHQNFVSEY